MDQQSTMLLATKGGRMRLSLLVACLAFQPALVLAAPPPPPPAFIEYATEILKGDLTPQTFDAYAATFADDLHVFIDGRQTASEKASWLALEKAKLGKVERHVVGYAEGHDNVLIVDQFDDRSNLPVRSGLVLDPRFVTRAARYKFGSDHLIHEIKFVEGGGFWVSTRKGD